MAPTKRRPGSDVALGEAAHRLMTTIRSDGRHDHITVRPQRGQLYVDVDADPIIRLEPLARDEYGLSFHHHTGRWEPTPFTGDVGHLAEVITTIFAPHLESYAFPPRKSGSDH